MTMPMHVSELTEDGLALCGERYLDMAVYAYSEEYPNDIGKRFSTHWSTPSSHNKIVRLFSEHDVEILHALLEDIKILAEGHKKSTVYDENGDNIALTVIVGMIKKVL